jgi:hypothetical protein
MLTPRLLARAHLFLVGVQLDSEREPIPDVPAVYFCRPTPENIRRIAKDCRYAASSIRKSFLNVL